MWPLSLKGGGTGKALVAGPLQFFCGFLQALHILNQLKKGLRPIHVRNISWVTIYYNYHNRSRHRAGITIKLIS